MFQSPRKAKRLYFDIIPKAVDEYITFVDKLPEQTVDQQLTNPTWHIHAGAQASSGSPVSFALLLNLVSASNAENKEVLWGFIGNYAPGVSAQSHPFLDRLTDYALVYYRDFVAPNKNFRAPSEDERAALADLAEKLAALDAAADAETIQSEVYAVGKAHFEDNLRGWFQTLYQVLLGQDQGPRFGSFVALYGLEKTRALIGEACAGKLA